jgi:ribosomal subunit interface protein
MRIQVSGRHVDVGDALRTHIVDELGRGVEKYFSRPAEATVTVEKRGHAFGVDCSVHLASGMLLQAHGDGGDAHTAFADALEKIEKRVRRYKRRLKNHHADKAERMPSESASSYVLEALTEDDDGPAAAANGHANGSANGHANGAEAAPLVIAETTAQIRTMAVADAVLQLDLTENPAIMFRNAAHGGLNMVYRRPDGNIGWIDADRTRQLS